MPEPQTTNRLIHESSPYLLQHAHNPVDWYPWGDEAFAKAKEEDKPILLSCGYSACHWCHVMEQESFEDPNIAKLMNDYFVNIKVDREVRPDIDQLYQEAIHAMGLQGGWPLTVFLDHRRRPFFGGTYFPPEPMYGRAGFPEILSALHQQWVDNRDRLEQVGAELQQHLALETAIEGPGLQVPDAELPVQAVLQLTDHFDTQFGGVAGAPKFPNTSLLQLFFRVANTRQLEREREKLIFTLEMMARGGIYDQLGGGFHRYSTDRYWLVPHFEKMLYDNAQLLKVYAVGYQLTRSPEFQQVIAETAQYIRREMTAPEGGFFATQDADSQGAEGLFYTWTQAEIRQELEPADAELLGEFYGVTAAGNFEDKRNILNRLGSADRERKEQFERPETRRQLAQARAKLFQARERRVKPFRDEKIITSWNGLMIGGFANVYQVLRDERDYHSARRAAEFILSQSRLPDGSLARVVLDGAVHTQGFLDDYSFMVQGLLHLYECDFDPRWLKESVALTEAAIAKFGTESGRYYLTAQTAEQLPNRPRSGGDQAIPSGVSLHLENLLKLAAYTGKPHFRETARQILTAYGAAMAQNVWGYAEMLGVLEAYHQGYQALSFITAQNEPPQLLLDLQVHYLPFRVLTLAREGADLTQHPARAMLEGKKTVDGQAACYACFDCQCYPPVTGWEELRTLINPREPLAHSSR